MSRRIQRPTNPAFNFRSDFEQNSELSSVAEMSEQMRNKMTPHYPSTALSVQLERYNDKKINEMISQHNKPTEFEFKF